MGGEGAVSGFGTLPFSPARPPQFGFTAGPGQAPMLPAVPPAAFANFGPAPINPNAPQLFGNHGTLRPAMLPAAPFSFGAAAGSHGPATAPAPFVFGGGAPATAPAPFVFGGGDGGGAPAPALDEETQLAIAISMSVEEQKPNNVAAAAAAAATPDHMVTDGPTAAAAAGSAISGATTTSKAGGLRILSPQEMQQSTNPELESAETVCPDCELGVDDADHRYVNCGLVFTRYTIFSVNFS